MKNSKDRSAYSTGIISAAGAYLMWGVIPLYWQFLKPASAPEILAHRVVWSLGLLLLIAFFTKKWTVVKASFTNKRTLLLLFLAAILVTINWGAFIWGVNNGHIIETSLGYFINPLVSVALGVIILKEKLNSLQIVAITLTFIAVTFLTLSLGKPPIVALTLAFSFGFYGLVKKLANVDAVSSLTVETLILTPFFLIFIYYLYANDQLSFTTNGYSHALWLTTAGIATVVPLLLFGTAVVRVPLVAIGLLQALGPILQFLIGYFIFHEEMSTARWFGFFLVWMAVSVFSFDAIKTYRKTN